MRTHAIVRKLHRAVLPLAAVPALLAATLSPASAAAGPYHAGWCDASGDFAVCVAGGTAYDPSIINVHVWATPNQKVDVSGTWCAARATALAPAPGTSPG